MIRTFLAIAVALCCGWAGLLQAQPLERPRGDAAADAVVINPTLDWRPTHWAGTRNTNAAARLVDDEAGTSRFVVATPGGTKVWIHYFGEKISWVEYPIAVLRYRAVRAGKPNRYLLWLDDGTGPNNGGLRVWMESDLVDDGQEHELRRDLRELEPRGDGRILSMALGASAGAQGGGVFELLALRFEKPADANKVEVKPDSPAREVELLVLDDQRRPVVNALVGVSAERLLSSEPIRTDGEGIARVPLGPGRTGNTTIRISKPSLARQTLTLDLAAPAPPRQVVVLEPAPVLRGRVTNQNGDALPFALAGLVNSDPRELDSAWSNLQAAALCDEQGRFQFEGLSSSLGGTNKLVFWHAEHLTRSVPLDSATQDMRIGNARFALQRGFTVRGQVLGQDGNPVTGATVARGQRLWGSADPSEISGDDQGRFVIPNLAAGELLLTVSAAGHGPIVHRINVDADINDLRVTLPRPQVVRFRVVDQAGEPVSGAKVSVQKWQGMQTLRWSGRAGASGRVEWTAAPPDEVSYTAYAPSLRSTQVTLKPQEQEHVITLTSRLTVSGTVTDAVTDKPIEHFTVIAGQRQAPNQPVNWFRQGAKTLTDGRYTHRFDFEVNQYVLRIEAMGYRPVISRDFLAGENQATWDVQLQPAKPIEGRVTLSDGSPAAGARVIVARQSENLFLQDGQPQGEGNMQAQADDQGRYAVPMQDEPFELVVLHDRGHAQVKQQQLEQSRDIPLSDWGRVEGTLHVGADPAPGCKIMVSHQPRRTRADMATHWVYYSWNCTTDEAGRFVVQRVPPGEFLVGRLVNMGSNDRLANHEMVQVEAGRTATVALGGVGRPVIGRLRWPASAAPAVATSRKFGFLQPEARASPGSALLDATLGKPKRPVRSFNFAIGDDGSFRVEDVPPGEYTLHVSVQSDQESVASLRHTFAVPAMEQRYSPEPLDLGELNLSVPKVPQVNEPAPDFEFATLDDRTLKLSDLRGKVVLLDFWAVWCGPCRGETPHLKAVYDKFAGNDRFLMVGLSLDKSKDAPRDYAAKNDLKWVQGFLGDWSKTKVPESFGVRGIPAIFLIGPDGRIIAKGLRGQGIAPAVEQALRALPAEAGK